MAEKNKHIRMSLVVVILCMLGSVTGCGRQDTVSEQQPTPELKVETTKNDAFPEMVFIKGGTFHMGSSLSEKGRDDDEGPVHEVTVSDFYIGKYEVTFAQYDAFCDATDRDRPYDAGYGRGNRPVISVSWYDATAYCDWLSTQTHKVYRLPTEAEWEYACRAGTKTRYSFGDSESALGQYAWYSSNSGGKAHEVGGKKPNQWGIYDMHGNVCEWCSDWYDEDYYESSPKVDPTGSWSVGNRVLRGGSWVYNPKRLRSANRDWGSTDSPIINDGFRVVRDP